MKTFKHGSANEGIFDIITDVLKLQDRKLVSIGSKFLAGNAIEKVLCLTRRREKFLVVAAIRFMRTIISRNDEQLLRHIVKNNLMRPIIEAFVKNGNRYNMLHSGFLELVEYIWKENQKTLITYMVSSFWDQLKRFEHLSTIQALRLKYEQSLETGDKKAIVNIVDPRKRIDERALEKEEEDYFNEDSDEEDSASARISGAKHHRAASTVLPTGVNVASSVGSGTIGLVDYEDDEEEAEYNPPPRSEPSKEDEYIITDLSRSKHKLASLGDNKGVCSELKKRRVNHHSREVKAVEVKNFKHGDKTSTTELPPSTNCSLDSNNEYVEHGKQRENAPELSNKVPSTTNKRPSNGRTICRPPQQFFAGDYGEWRQFWSPIQLDDFSI
ncbi:hypothetical protein HPP92_010370 [Vanilla planifolia]|uniref:Serine/threonine-protein phosphatase 4 regulatory subunit 3-like central domain-containing protein n=1 Tax=Vanilla planifolia TaxID=51239 RepID=A0A835QYS1_VANPL|nr:hypothetical protein HPP92_010370 [Vanilla planifolia]